MASLQTRSARTLYERRFCEYPHREFIPYGTQITGQYLKILWLLPPDQTSHQSWGVGNSYLIVILFN